MTLDYPATRRTAIVGGGISGLAAAYELSKTEPVTLIEAAPRLGGHAHTVMAGKNGDQPVDMGFIVFNYHTYPNLIRMFDELDVPVKPSAMSFAASIGNGAMEYGLKNMAAITGQKSNLARPQFWRMFSDLFRFNKHAAQAVEGSDQSLGDFLDDMNLGRWFREYYLLPISGAIWSSTPEQMRDFPARSLVQFFQNHALLSRKNHKWYTVDGGSIEYVRRIEAAIRANGGEILTGAPVTGVRRASDEVQISIQGTELRTFDDVIFGCHSDEALALLETPTEEEQRILGAMRYQPNRAILHHDANLMPKRRNCWASWNYLSPDMQPKPSIGLTYWMNSLQGIDETDPLFVSLNPALPIREELIYAQADFAHPVFDAQAIAAQKELPSIQGENRTWYAGAYTRWGFHEDGYASAMNVIEGMATRNLVLAA